MTGIFCQCGMHPMAHGLSVCLKNKEDIESKFLFIRIIVRNLFLMLTGFYICSSVNCFVRCCDIFCVSNLDIVVG